LYTTLLTGIGCEQIRCQFSDATARKALLLLMSMLLLDDMKPVGRQQTFFLGNLVRLASCITANRCKICNLSFYF